MTAEDIYQKYNDEFHLEGNNGGIQKHKSFILKMMNDFARLMCDKQKEICADDAETKDVYPNGSYMSLMIINEDSILNAPYPPQLL